MQRDRQSPLIRHDSSEAGSIVYQRRMAGYRAAIERTAAGGL